MVGLVDDDDRTAIVVDYSTFFHSKHLSPHNGSLWTDSILTRLDLVFESGSEAVSSSLSSDQNVIIFSLHPYYLLAR